MQRDKKLYAEKYDTDEINKRGHKQMKRYIMSLNCSKQYFENDYIIQSNLQIQCKPHQINNGIFHRTRKKKKELHNFYGNTKQPWIAKSILRKKNGARWINLPDFRL